MSVQVKGSGTIGGLDEGLVISGIVTSSTQINVGSNIKFGSAGIASASNFKTGSSNLHSTGLTVGNNFLHSTGINVGTGATIHVPATNVLTLGTNSNERLRINSDGKVGLGTTGSDYALSIREADNNNKWLMFQKNSGQQILQIREDGDNHAIIDGSHASGELHFYTAGSERLRITSTGYIGINTSSPQYPLHVAGHTTNSAPDGIGVLMGLQHNHALIHLNAESDLGLSLIHI